MKTYIFEGVVTTLAPLTVSLKDSQTSLGHRLPRNGNFRAKPYFPATSFRGALRHSGHVALARHLKKDDVHLSLADHFALAQGVDIKGDADQFDGGAIDATKNLREMNPFISIWGRWGVDGHVGIGNLFPTTEDCVSQFGGGARTIMFERNQNLLEHLSESDVSELNHILQEQTQSAEDIKPLKAQITSLTKSLKTLADPEAKSRVQEKIKVLEAEIEGVKDAKTGSRESIRRPIDTYEAFVAGCEFEHRMVLKSASQTELSILLACFQEFAREPSLGGHKAHGCGAITGQYSVKVWPEDKDKPVEVGTLSWDSTGFHVTGDELTAALGQWKKAVADYKAW